MPNDLNDALNQFYSDNAFRTKGKLCVALVMTQNAREGLPLDPNNLLTEKGGQVAGLSGEAVQKILAKYGITKVLAREGGRTSRGSMDAMKTYVSFLNALAGTTSVNIDAVEAFWIRKVELFFASKPLKVKLDSSHGLRSLVRDLILQGEVKQKESQGVYYVGAILQHLVGAKLDCALGKGRFRHNSFSTSDAQTGRSGDFLIDKAVVHVTTTPTEAVIARCRDNLDLGLRPILVTTRKHLALAEGLAENASLQHRIDIFEVEQFIALNLYEFAKFEEKGRSIAVGDLVKRYNEIVEEFETDPSLIIEIS